MKIYKFIYKIKHKKGHDKKCNKAKIYIQFDNFNIFNSKMSILLTLLVWKKVA